MEDMNQVSSTTPSADDFSKLVQKQYMEEPSDLMENNEAQASVCVEDILDLAGGAADALLRHQSASPPRPADAVNQAVPNISFSKPEPFAMPEGTPTETEQHQGEKKQTKTQTPDTLEKTAAIAEEKKPEAPKPDTSPSKLSPSPVSSSSSSGFSNEIIFPSSEPLMQPFAESFVDMPGQPRSTPSLDQKDGSSVLLETVAPVSSLSPLPSPDSLEELSLSESSDQAPALAKVQETVTPDSLLQTVEDSASKVPKDVPLTEEVKTTECKTETEISDTKLSLDSDIKLFETHFECLATPPVGEAVELPLKMEEDTKVEKAIEWNTGMLGDVLQTTTTPLEPDQIADAQQEHRPEMSSLKHVDLQIGSELKEQTSPVPEKPEVDRIAVETDKIVGIALESPVDTVKTLFCKIGGFEFSPDDQVGHLVESQKNEKSQDELDFTLGEDAESPLDTTSGSSSEQSPLTPEVQSTVTAQSYVTFDTAAFNSPQPDFPDARKAVTSPLAYNVEKAEGEILHEKKEASALERSVQPESFLDFQPISAARTGLPQAIDAVLEGSAVTVSESPTPDLVQGAFDNEFQDVSQIKPSDETSVDLVQKTFESIQEPSVCQSGSPKEPPSLPDILESPLSSGKVAAGSSEGTPDSEPSPVKETKMEAPAVPVIFEALKPLAFVSDSQISPNQETCEAVSFKAVQKAAPAFDDVLDRMGACDLVKEAQTTSDLTAQLDREENEFSVGMGRRSSGLLESIKESPSFEQVIELSTSPSEFSISINEIHKMKEPLQESPASEAMGESIKATVPVGFVMESECKSLKELEKLPTEDARAFSERVAHLEKPVETVELEGSMEYGITAEEFEIIEAVSSEPLTRGVVDEFLETLDNSSVSSVSKLGTECEMPSIFGRDDLDAKLGEHTEFTQVHVSSQQSSFALSSEPAPKAASLKIDLEPENQITPPEPLKEVKLQEMVTKVPNVPSKSEEAENPVPLPKADEDQPPSDTERPEVHKIDQTPNLSTEAVVDLLYWRDIKKTGVVFGASLFLLLSLTVCSIVSVFSYLALALLSVSITFRIYKGILQAIQKSDEGHPFKAYLDSDVAVSEEVVHKYSDVTLGHINCALKELRHLFLVEDLVDSLKFAVLMWILTYVGALFNGLTLLILALISVFSIPVIYERHQAQIDHYLALVNNQVKDIVAKIQAKVPGLKRKTE